MAMEKDDDFATTNLAFKKILASLFGLSTDYIGTNCSTTSSDVRLMKDDPDGWYRYGTGASCSDACTDAETLNSSTVQIYNTTGGLHDNTVPAFSTLQGGNTSNNTSAGGTKNDELIDNNWYAVYDGTANTSRKVAQYNQSGSGGFWDHPKTCSC